MKKNYSHTNFPQFSVNFESSKNMRHSCTVAAVLTVFFGSLISAFGSLPSPDVKGIMMPPKTLEEKQCGNMRGLQGHHNSCYLDATLYSMFAFSSVFDTLLHRQRKDGDLKEYEKVQTVLREWIVNPLRV